MGPEFFACNNARTTRNGKRHVGYCIYEFHYILSILLPLFDASVKILAVDIILPFIVTAQQRSKHRLLGLILRESVRIDNWVLL